MIAFIGNKETVLPFKILGVDIFVINNKAELSELELKKYKIIFVAEEFFSEEFKAKFQDKIISPFPSLEKKENIGVKRISKIAEKAIGTSILKK